MAGTEAGTESDTQDTVMNKKDSYCPPGFTSHWGQETMNKELQI